MRPMGVLVWLESLPLSVWVHESPSVWAQPTVLTLHTMGMGVLVGASWVLDLRLLGISRNIPLSAFRWVFRAVAVGLIVNVVTGVLLFAQRATSLGTGDPVSHQDGPGHRQRRHLGAAPLARVAQRPGRSARSAAARVSWRSPRSSRGPAPSPRAVCSPTWSPSGAHAFDHAVNLAHLHLLLNHVPTVGAVVALGLLIVAFVRRDEPLKLAGLEVLFAIAVLTLPVYMSGVAAYQKLRDQPEISDTAIRVHQDAALAGFTVTEFAGFIAWVALWQSRRRSRAAPRAGPGRDAAVDCGARADGSRGDAGRRDSPSGDPDRRRRGRGRACQPIRSSSSRSKISEVMVNSTWAWPASETVHFLGLSLSFGVLLAVNLRILGVMRQVPFADVHRLLPWGMLGFGANLITGMLFFVGQPKQYIDSAPFYWKVVFLMIAGANFLYLTVFKKAWAVDRWDASRADKAMAILSLFSWLAVLYGGRMLPFIGHAF